jgi:hypothetical protein
MGRNERVDLRLSSKHTRMARIDTFSPAHALMKCIEMTEYDVINHPFLLYLCINTFLLYEMVVFARNCIRTDFFPFF